MLRKERAERIIRRYGRDILNSDGMHIEKNCLQHGQISVYEHSYMVAVLCVELAIMCRIRADMRALVRGALLHDYFLYDWHEKDKSHRLHGFIHAERALKNAESDFRLLCWREPDLGFLSTLSLRRATFCAQKIAKKA